MRSVPHAPRARARCSRLDLRTNASDRMPVAGGRRHGRETPGRIFLRCLAADCVDVPPHELWRVASTQPRSRPARDDGGTSFTFPRQLPSIPRTTLMCMIRMSQPAAKSKTRSEIIWGKVTLCGNRRAMATTRRWIMQEHPSEMTESAREMCGAGASTAQHRQA